MSDTYADRNEPTGWSKRLNALFAKWSQLNVLIRFTTAMFSSIWGIGTIAALVVLTVEAIGGFDSLRETRQAVGIGFGVGALGGIAVGIGWCIHELDR